MRFLVAVFLLYLPAIALAGECTCDNHRQACRYIGACCGPASMYCGGGGDSPSQPTYPPGSVVCGGGTWCPSGTKCGSGDRCIDPSAVDCGNGTSCSAGNRCAQEGGCVARDAVKCGDYRYCAAGDSCGRLGNCVAPGYFDCGNGRSCPDGATCASGRLCLLPGEADCGDGRYCSAGYFCGSGNKCMREGRADCGDGTSCSSGYVCGTGSVRCLKPGAIDCGDGRSCNKGTFCSGNGSCYPVGSTVCSSGGYCGEGTKCGVSKKGCISIEHVQPPHESKVVHLDERKDLLRNFAAAFAATTTLRQKQDFLKAAMQILAASWMTAVPVKGFKQREVVIEEARKALIQLLKAELAAVVSQMTNDVSRLEPLAWDSEETKAQKREEAEKTSRELQQLLNDAGAELDDPKTFVEIESKFSQDKRNYLEKLLGGSHDVDLYFTPGPSLHRLEEIRRTGRYWD